MAYEVYLVLIKLDFFFLIGFIVQYNLIDVHFEEPEYSLTMAIIPAAFIVMILGIYFVQHEIILGIVPVIVRPLEVSDRICKLTTSRCATWASSHTSSVD